MNSNRIDFKYIENLHDKQKKLEEKLREREKERQKANEIFLEHIKKQLEMLTNEKDKMNARNEEFLQATHSYSRQFSRLLPELMEAEDRLKQAKVKYLAYIDKQNN